MLLPDIQGEKFDISWEDILNVFHHIYSKEYGHKKKIKVRKEVQEYLNRSFKKHSWTS